MTTLNEQIDEVEIMFKGLRRLTDAFSETDTVLAIKNAINNKTVMTSLKKKYEYVDDKTKDGSVEHMIYEKFIKAEETILTGSSSELTKVPTPSTLDVYENTLPYGVAGPNRINTELYKVDETNWVNFSKYFTRIFATIAKSEIEELRRNSSQNKLTIQNFLSSFCGSLSEWPQVNPISGGIGDCKTLYGLFGRHYMDDSLGGRINESKFYEEFIGSLYTSHIHSAYKNLPKNGIQSSVKVPDFKSEIKAYNFNPELWFESNDPAHEDEYKYNGYRTKDSDSYGNFIECGGFPIKLETYIGTAKYHGDLAGRTLNDAEYQTISALYGDCDYTGGRTGIKDPTTGAYLQVSINYNNFLNNFNVVVVNGAVLQQVGKPNLPLNKRYCMLYHHELSKDTPATELNKQTPITDPLKYLFNSQSKCVSPYVLQDDNS